MVRLRRSLRRSSRTSIPSASTHSIHDAPAERGSGASNSRWDRDSGRPFAPRRPRVARNCPGVHRIASTAYDCRSCRETPSARAHASIALYAPALRPAAVRATTEKRYARSASAMIACCASATRYPRSSGMSLCRGSDGRPAHACDPVVAAPGLTTYPRQGGIFYRCHLGRSRAMRSRRGPSPTQR